MDKVLEYIEEDLKDVISEGQYLELTNRLKAAYDEQQAPKVKYQAWQEVRDALEEAGLPDTVPEYEHHLLDIADAEDLPYAIGKVMVRKFAQIAHLERVVINDARYRSDLVDEIRRLRAILQYG